MQNHPHLRRISDKYSITLPKQLLDQIDLQPGAHVDITVDQGRLVLEPVDVQMQIRRRSDFSTEPNS